MYCTQHIVLGTDNKVIHDRINKEGSAHLDAYLASNKAAQSAFKSPTKPTSPPHFDPGQMSFVLEDSTKGFSKDVKDSHVAALKLLCAKYDPNEKDWSFPSEDDLHPALVQLMKAGAKADTPLTMHRKLTALQRRMVEQHPDMKIGMEANPTTMNRASWSIFGRTDFRDEPYRSKEDFLDSSTWSVFNVFSEESSRAAAKEIAKEENAKAMVGKETSSSTIPTRSVDCYKILHAVECIANFGLLILLCSSSKDGSVSDPAEWPYITTICENLLKAIIGTERSDGNRKGWIQDVNTNAPWTTMVILQRFANLMVKFFQMVVDVQINQRMTAGNDPDSTDAKLAIIPQAYHKLWNDIIAAREDSTNLGGSEPPLFYQHTCPTGYAKLCTA